jgi:hypothetical protein
MSETDRLALSRGTLAGCVDVAQVQAARQRAAQLELATRPEAADWPLRVYLLAGTLAAALVWLAAGT